MTILFGNIEETNITGVVLALCIVWPETESRTERCVGCKHPLAQPESWE